MAAGLGFKTFTTGEVLTAADTNGYLMQGVLVFASAAARSAAITSPQEGQYSYLKDTNSTEYYDGAAWVAGVEGDISGVTAGTGISGGGTSGTVTITNSMATAIDAKGDLVVGTGADAFSRLAVSATNGTILTVDSAEATGLKYAGNWVTFTPGAIGGFTLGNGTINARYCRVGKVTFVYFEFILGSTSAITGEITFQLPAAAGVIGGRAFNGTVTYIDAGTQSYGGSIETTIGGSTLYMRVTSVNSTYPVPSLLTTAAVPFTWGTNDYFIGYLWYEVQ